MNARIITIMLIFCLVATGVTAQQRKRQRSKATTVTEQAMPKVLSMKLATASFIPANEQRKDNNGDICALVKVQVLDNFTEESSSIGEVVNRGIEKWVYIYKGAKRMKLFFKNNLPLTVTFSDHGIKDLESNRVYELQIQVPNQSDKSDVPDGTLHLSVNPPSAEITLWGDNLSRMIYRPQADGTLTLTLPWGRYYYAAIADGYDKLEGSFFVNDEGRQERIDFATHEGTLLITCGTDKTDIYIDDQFQGTSKRKKKLTLQLRTGSHTLTASRKGYVSQTQTINILTDQTSTIDIPKLVSDDEVKKKELEEKRATEAAAKKKKRAETAETKKVKREEARKAKAEQRVKDSGGQGQSRNNSSKSNRKRKADGSVRVDRWL